MNLVDAVVAATARAACPNRRDATGWSAPRRGRKASKGEATMWARRLAAFAIALILAAGWLALWFGERDSSGDADAPDQIESTYARLSIVCLVAPICPVSRQALDAMKRAIAGDPEAEDWLALSLLTGDGLPRNRETGRAWLARAAERGEPRAARDVADRLRDGENLAVDERAVAAALSKRVDDGDAEAMRALGPMIARGRGAKQDVAAGLAMMRRAVDLGSTGAAYDLANLYSQGAPGLPASRAQYLAWMEVAARRGEPEAMLSLGYASLDPPAAGGERDLTRGFCWLMRAALLDNPRAQEKLSLAFAEGEREDRDGAIAVDLVQADAWFRLAARSPFHDNSQIRGLIEPNMTSDNLDAAKRLVEAWRPQSLDALKTLVIPLPPAVKGGPSPGACPPMAS
jgi:TPR repeat protein